MAFNDNALRARGLLSSLGYSPAATAGVLGAGHVESGWRTGAVNPGDGADGSNSIGVFQWNGPRAQALQSFASANNLDPNSLEGQVRFFDHESRTTERGAGDALRSASTPAEATAAMLRYERPAGYTADNPMAALTAGERLAATNQAFGLTGPNGYGPTMSMPGAAQAAGGFGPSGIVPSGTDNSVTPAAGVPMQTPAAAPEPDNLDVSKLLQTLMGGQAGSAAAPATAVRPTALPQIQTPPRPAAQPFDAAKFFALLPSATRSR